MKRMRAPLQERSRQTHEALLDAAEEIGNTRTFDQLTIQDVAARAGFTIGAFYARFPSKTSLLDALMQRYEAMIDLAKRGFDVGQPDPRPVRKLADAFIRAYGTKTGRLRLIESAIHSDSSLAARIAALRTDILDFTVETLRRSYNLPRTDLETAALLLIVPLRELHYKQEFWPEASERAAFRTDRVVDAVTAFLETLEKTHAKKPARGKGKR